MDDDDDYDDDERDPPPEQIREQVLDGLINSFRRINPECNEPLLIADKCAGYSGYFQSMLESAGFDARLIYGLRMGEFMGQQTVFGGHIAVEYDGLVYDWTARQFEPDAPVPTITTVAEFRAVWPLGGTTEKEK